MLGAAPTQAPTATAAAVESSQPRRGKWLVAASVAALLLFVLVPAGSGAVARGVAAEHAKAATLPRLWAVQVDGDARGWFSRSTLKAVRENGINAVAVRIAALGPRRAGKRRFNSVLQFATSEKLYAVAVLPRGTAHTPAARRALSACSGRGTARLRCALLASSPRAAVALARKRGSRHRWLVAVYVNGPAQLAGLVESAKGLRRRLIVIAPLPAAFDSSSWGAAIAQVAATPSVDAGVAPQAAASTSVRQFAALLSGRTSSSSVNGGHGKTKVAAPTGLATSSVTQSSMTLSWTLGTGNVVGYELSLNGRQVGTSSSTDYVYTGLACGTSYTLGVTAYDAAGAVSPTATTSHATSSCSDTQAPSTPSGLATSAIGQTSMALSWSPSTDNVGVAGYRLFLNGSQVGTSSSTNYAFSGMVCGTSYTLGVAAYDAAGNVSNTASTSQATSACPDTQAPSKPSGLATGSVTQTSIALSWSASTDNVGVAGYRLYRNGTQVATSTSTSYGFSGLTCGTSYTLGVAAYDAAGNVSATATVSHSTSACPDTQPPSTPSGLATSSVTSTSMTLSWTASTDNVGVAGYRLFRNGTQVGTSTSTSYSFTSLSCGTSYTLGVAAYDAAGNVSATATVSQSTSACSGDTQPPSTPTGLATSSVAQTSVTLSWTASTDNVGVTGYRLFLNGTQVGTSTTTSYSFTGLGCATSYTLGVAAYDAAGNVSGTATLTQTTSACPPPATPTNLAVSAVTQTSLTLSWASSGVGVAGYRLFLNGTQVGTSSTTSYAFGALTCGTAYTLGVAAYDAAGDVSGTATTNQTTAACATGGATTWSTANVWVSSTGHSSCSRSASLVPYSSGAANDCSSMQAAQTAANGGDRVVVEAGTYPAQTISSGAKSSAVTYYAQSYVQATTAVDVLSATTDVTLASLAIDIDHVHVYGIQATAQGFVNGGETMDQLTTLQVTCNTCTDVLIDGWRGHVADEDGTGITFDHLEIGNANYCSSTVEERDAMHMWASGVPSNNDSLLNSVLHDWYDGSAAADGACGQGSGGAHDDCVQSPGGTNQVIAGNLFYKCGSSSVIQMGEFSGGIMGNITIQNNYFGDKPTEYNILSIGQGHCAGVVIRNNDFESGNFDNNGGCIGTPTQDNNIMLGPVSSCNNGGSFSGTGNIFVATGGTTCGTNAKRCTPTFVSGLPTEYAYWQPALAATDMCAAGHAVTDIPATDFYGTTRPSVAAAGASEPGSG